MIKFIRNVLELLDWSLLLPKHEAKPIHEFLDKRERASPIKAKVEDSNSSGAGVAG